MPETKWVGHDRGKMAGCGEGEDMYPKKWSVQ